MNYYKQGDAANADKIKAAFEGKGIYSTCNFENENYLYYSCDGKVAFCFIGGGLANIIKTHPDYKELELPVKPHYDITNFHAGMPVLVRWYNTGRWRYSLYSFYEEDSINPFDTVKGSFTQCIPFNEDTKHLLGTTDMPSEEYINW